MVELIQTKVVDALEPSFFDLLLEKGKDIWDNYGDEILLGGQIAGFAATAFFSSKNARSLDEELDRIEAERTCTKKDICKEAVKAYWPTGLAMTFGIGCSVSSYIRGKKAEAASMAAFTALATAFQAYRNKDEQNDISEEPVEVIDGDPETGELTAKPEDITHLYHYEDGIHDIWFKATELDMMKVELTLNKNLYSKCTSTVNDMFDSLGLELTKAGEYYGWDFESLIESGGYGSYDCWVTLKYTTRENEKGEEYKDIWFTWGPDYYPLRHSNLTDDDVSYYAKVYEIDEEDVRNLMVGAY